MLLDLLVWRWRRLANWLLYYEFLSALAQGMVPFDYGNFDILVVFLQNLVLYMVIVCQPGQSIVVFML